MLSEAESSGGEASGGGARARERRGQPCQDLPLRTYYGGVAEVK
jgi:hypothetical protein